MIAIKTKKLLIGSFWLLASVAVSRLAGLLLKIPLANLLGGTGMGYYSSAYAVFMPLYAVAAGSLPPAIAHYTAKSLACGREDEVKRLKISCIVFFGAIGLLLSLIPLVFSGFIAQRIIGNPESRLSVAAISPCVFFGTVTAIYRGISEGRGSMAPTALSQMTDAIVKLISGLGLATLTRVSALNAYSRGLSVFGRVCVSEQEAISAALPYISAAAVLGTAIADLASMLYMIIDSKRLKTRHKALFGQSRTNPPLPDGRLIKELAGGLLPIAMASLITSLLGTIDLFTIISILKGCLRKYPELYSAVYSSVLAGGVSLKELPNFLYGSFSGLSMAIFTLAPSLCAVFGKSAFPDVAGYYASGKKELASREIRRSVTIANYIAIPAGLGLCLFSREILSLLFSQRQAEISVSYLPLSVLAVGTPFLAVLSISDSLLQAIGRQDITVRITLIGAVTKLAFNTLLIPFRQWGLCGASAATVLSYIVMCIMSVHSLYRLTGTKARLSLSVAVPIAVGGVSVLAGRLFYQRLPDYYRGSGEVLGSNEAASLLLAVGISVILYILLSVFLDISTKNKLREQIFD
ncbi:MAG TPA: polysaccharide biosynthesis C-terminal domain-containing protein [Candidatus Faeciplasma avium]|uniref:Polysaccharide biosynthesis C-terminal domain-containing protein n=1 Tax=Candidatus Faeciplasma avium TaxID=2840798 RepID=A0A9D1NR53_9FIRM|nr:polysaccharide biosynthesis C-terminal domain-containing protein [Candidatus Faeciplasma avium]